MRILSTSILLFCSVVVTACSAEPIAAEYNELYLDPQSYKGKTIEINGWLEFHFEGSIICASQEAMDHCLSIDYAYHKQYEVLNGKRVKVVGEFYPEKLDYEPTRREHGKLVIQFGPYFHTLNNIKIELAD
jgi:hypothetical protein